MPPWVLDLIFLVITLGMTYALLSEGMWGAALMFFNALFAGLITFNFYEPLAKVLAESASFMTDYADMVCILVLFGATLFALRLTTDSIAPGMVRFPSILYWLGGVVFGLGASVITTGIILLAFQAAPVHKKVLGSITYDSKPPFKMGLDHQWLALFQQSSGVPFARYHEEYPPDRFGYFGRGAGMNLFDPNAEWLIRHQEARPHGEGAIQPTDGGDSGGGGGQPMAGGAGGGGGGPAPAGSTIGGTMGAAAGVAAPLP